MSRTSPRLFDRTIKQSNNETLAFLKAANGNDLSTIKALVTASADKIDFNAIDPSSDRTALGLACHRNNVEMMQYFLDLKKFDVDQYDDVGYAPLHHAAEMGRQKIAELLIDQGHAQVDILTNDRESNTPLHLAACNGHTTTVQSLYDRGADLTLLSQTNMTALDLAQDGFYNETADLLESLSKLGASL